MRYTFHFCLQHCYHVGVSIHAARHGDSVKGLGKGCRAQAPQFGFVVRCHGLGRLGGLGFAGRRLLLNVVPMFHPVMRAKLLPCDLPVEVLFKRQAVVWGKGAQQTSPGPDVSAVLIAEDASDFCMAVTCKLKHAKVCFDLHMPQV